MFRKFVTIFLENTLRTKYNEENTESVGNI